MSAFQTRPLTADMVLRVYELDPKKICGRFTQVREVWRVVADGHATAPQDDHFVFVEPKRGMYCSRCGRDCAAVAAVESERVKRQAAAR
jgi:hypothetical protein